MMSGMLGAICGISVPDESWHCPWENKFQALCLLLGPQWPGLHPRGQPKNRALVTGWLSSHNDPDWNKVAGMIQNKFWPCCLWMLIRKGDVCFFGWFWWSVDFTFWVHHRFDLRQTKRRQIITVPLQACVTDLIVESFYLPLIEPSPWERTRLNSHRETEPFFYD